MRIIARLIHKIRILSTQLVNIVNRSRITTIPTYFTAHPQQTITAQVAITPRLSTLTISANNPRQRRISLTEKSNIAVTMRHMMETIARQTPEREIS